MNWLAFSILLLGVFKNISGYFVSVDANAEECFFDRVEAGTKMGLMFETVDGGFLDITVKITGPDNKVIYTGEREQSGKYTFAAHSTGIHTYCFDNTMSTMTTKLVMFTMEIGETPSGTPGAPKEDEAGHAKLEDMIKELSGTLNSIKHEQSVMIVRDRMHRSINESTNSRVVLWSTFEALVLVVMTVGQVYYLKRFFEVRRVV